MSGTGTLFPDLTPPPAAPKTERAKYIRQCQALVLRRVLAGKKASTENIWPVLPVPPGMDARVLGDVFHGLMADGSIEAVDFIRSSRPCRHRGVLRNWKLLDRIRARGTVHD